MTRFRFSRYTLLIAAISGFGSVSTLARVANNGVGLHWDSINYIDVARNLLEGNGFINFYGTLYTDWPPFYPALLALASFGIFDPLDVVTPINAILFGLTIFFTGHYLLQRLNSQILTLVSCLAVAVSTALTGSASWALTEPAFILFTVLALIKTDKYLKENTYSALIGAAILTALAFLTRYIGITVLISILWVLILQRNITLLEKAKRITTFSLIAAGPVSIWMYRNELLTGNLTGYRDYSHQPILEVMKRIPYGLAELIFSDPESPVPNILLEGNRYTIAAWVVGSALILLMAVVVYFLIRSRHQSGVSTFRRSISIFGGFILTYIFAFIVTVSQGSVSNEGVSRYLLPLYIPLLILVVMMLDWLVSSYHASNRTIFESANALPTYMTLNRRIFLLSVLPIWLTFQLSFQFSDSNSGYSVERWRTSEVLQYLRSNPIESAIFSNDPHPIYHYTGLQVPYRYLPRSFERSLYVWRRNLSPHRNVSSNSSDRASRSDFDLHLGEATLTYVKEECSQKTTRHPFFLHIFPVNIDDLTEVRKPYGFDNYDFYFDWYGIHSDGTCTVTIRLPEYPITRILTGQYIDGNEESDRTALEQYQSKLKLLGESIADGSYVVWFYNWHLYRFPYSAEDLRELPDFEIVADLDDGIIFKVTRSAEDDAIS